MEERLDVEIDDLGKEFAKNFNRSREDTHIRRARRPAGLLADRSTLIIVGIGVVFLIVIIVFLFGVRDEVSVADINTIRAKLGEVEQRLATIGGVERKVASLENQVKRLEQSVSRLKRPVVTRGKATIKGNHYHEVQRGDTLSGIAQRYGMTVKELCRLNKITPETTIRPGQKLLLAPES
ncbi:MAG: LysM peptidoglycan-binding domain-containing protein [Desulfobacteraceae bacterium]|jgi:LysM repeat protein